MLNERRVFVFFVQAGNLAVELVLMVSAKAGSAAQGAHYWAWGVTGSSAVASGHYLITELL